MRIEKTYSPMFGNTKQSTIKKIISATKKCADIQVIKNYSQYVEAYGLGKKINKTA